MSTKTTAELAGNQIMLSDGRIVTIREYTGADEMIVAAQLGKIFEANGSGAFIFQTCLITRCIEKVGEEKPPIMKSYEDYRTFNGQFKGKDYTRIKTLYNTVNGDDDDEKKASEQE